MLGVDGADPLVGDGDAGQHRSGGLGHRMRDEAMSIVPRVLALVGRDEEPRLPGRAEHECQGIRGHRSFLIE